MVIFSEEKVKMSLNFSKKHRLHIFFYDLVIFYLQESECR